MKTTLRDHPFLTDQGVRSWPPAWLRTSGNESTTAAGEVGILQDVKTHDPISSTCFLFIEYSGATFVGRISLDSAALCQKMVKLLKQHCGKPLKSIGELGVDLADIQGRSAARPKIRPDVVRHEPPRRCSWDKVGDGLIVL